MNAPLLDSCRAATYNASRVKTKIYSMHILRTGNAGSQSDEGNRVHSVLEVDEAAEMSGDISDDGGAAADRKDGNDKGGVPIVNG